MAKTVHERVRARLKRAKRKQQDLAGQVGISPAYLSQILSGKRRVSLALALKLEQATGVPARDFAGAA